MNGYSTYEDYQRANNQVRIKSIVTFIAGLLMGGALLWAFSSPPPTPPLTPEQEEVRDELKTEAKCLSLKKDIATVSSGWQVRRALVELEVLGDKCK